MAVNVETNATTIRLGIGASPLRPAYTSGFWYPAGAGVNGNGAAPGANSIRAYPFRIVRAVTISDLAACVTTAHAANNFQLAIYAHDAAAGLPTGSELAKTGNMSTAATGVITADITGANVALAPGIYWACVNTSSGSVIFVPFSINNSDTAELVGASAASSIFGGAAITGVCVSTPVTFGTWGDLTAASWTPVTTSSNAALGFKVA